MRLHVTPVRLAAGLLAAALCYPAAARAVDLQELVRETQHISQEESRLTLVWWIPQEYWQASLEKTANLRPEQRAAMLAALEDLQIMALFRGKIGVGGVGEMPSREDMIAHSRFESNGNIIKPLEQDKLNTGAQVILATLKPMLAGMLGQLGQGLQLVVYPSKHGAERLIDPKKPGSFQYTFYDQTFKWRLPLASLLPNKVDPNTKEEFPGDYEFNPYTGVKLNSK
jgi:hypothetical protein